MSADGGSGQPGAVLDAAGSAKALNAIRQEAIGGLLALRRVGMGIGGLLTGVRGEKFRVLGTLEIPCSHTRGPGFLLTPEELDEAGQLKSAAAPFEVLGLYLSKTRGAPELAAEDLVLFDAICPEAGQIAMVIRPSTVEPVRAALFVRREDNSVRLECEWELVQQAEDTAVSAPEPERVPVARTPEPAVAVPAAPMIPVVAPPAIPFIPITPAIAPARKSAVLFRGPEPEARPGTRRTLTYAAAITILIAAAVAAAARGHWTTPPALALDVADDNGAIVFHWNRDAVAGENKGRLLVNDAGELSEFPLSGDRLTSGVFRYVRKSDRIVAKLAVGDQEARAVYFGKDTATPSATASGTAP